MTGEASDSIHFVLVGTTHPGNIGATARAMKTMGMRSLRLVNPKVFPSAEVTARAAGADDILARAVVFDSLAAAVADCGLVLATTARVRSLSWPELVPAEAASRAVDTARAGTAVAVVFGRERSGLSNEELDLCNGAIRIPANPEFSSLNIASAVQIIAYELFSGLNGGSLEPGEVESPPADAEQMEHFFEHLEACLADIGFHDREKPRRLMRRMRRLFLRAHLDQNEYNIMRGILAAAQRAAKGGD